MIQLSVTCGSVEAISVALWIRDALDLKCHFEPRVPSVYPDPPSVHAPESGLLPTVTAQWSTWWQGLVQDCSTRWGMGTYVEVTLPAVPRLTQQTILGHLCEPLLPDTAPPTDVLSRVANRCRYVGLIRASSGHSAARERNRTSHGRTQPRRSSSAGGPLRILGVVARVW